MTVTVFERGPQLCSGSTWYFRPVSHLPSLPRLPHHDHHRCTDCDPSAGCPAHGMSQRAGSPARPRETKRVGVGMGCPDNTPLHVHQLGRCVCWGGGSPSRGSVPPSPVCGWERHGMLLCSRPTTRTRMFSFGNIPPPPPEPRVGTLPGS